LQAPLIPPPQITMRMGLLGDDELAALVPFCGVWDECYIGVLAGIAATPVRTQAPVSRPRQLQFSFIEAEL
jgi:hypothetical protein